MKPYIWGFLKGIFLEFLLLLVISIILVAFVPNWRSNEKIIMQIRLIFWLINLSVSFYLINKYKMPRVMALVALIFAPFVTVGMLSYAEKNTLPQSKDLTKSLMRKKS